MTKILDPKIPDRRPERKWCNGCTEMLRKEDFHTITDKQRFYRCSTQCILCTREANRNRARRLQGHEPRVFVSTTHTRLALQELSSLSQREIARLTGVQTSTLRRIKNEQPVSIRKDVAERLIRGALSLRESRNQ